MKDNSNKKIIVLGVGVSGKAVCDVLISKRFYVVVYDSNPNQDFAEIKNRYVGYEYIEYVSGPLTLSHLNGVSLCIISPGISYDNDFLKLIPSEGIDIWSEIELGDVMNKGEMCAITGTNGKTTVTTLVGEILKSNFKDVHVCGNIGDPFVKRAMESTKETRTVLEVSSFQLEGIQRFRPKVSCILNLTPDHLDRHKTFENYINTKLAITYNQKEDDYIVINYDDEVLRTLYKREFFKCKVVLYSANANQIDEIEEGYYLKDKQIFYRSKDNSSDVSSKEKNQGKFLLNVNSLILLGRHNYENVMAAIAVANLMGVPHDKCVSVALNFKSVEHRIEYVRTRNGVKYYNDSKGTNPDAAIKAIEAIPGNIVLIAGGYDKHSNYTSFISAFGTKVKQLVLMGETADAIEKTAVAMGFTKIVRAKNMKEAVKLATMYSSPGEYVLLSPACASWDMYTSYEERGKDFKQEVNYL